MTSLSGRINLHPTKKTIYLHLGVSVNFPRQTRPPTSVITAARSDSMYANAIVQLPMYMPAIIAIIIGMGN